MIIFVSLLRQARILEMAQSLPEIGLSLKLNYNSLVKFVKIPDIHGTTTNIYLRTM